MAFPFPDKSTPIIEQPPSIISQTWFDFLKGLSTKSFVSSITAGTGLSGGTITGTGTIALGSGNRVLLNTLTASNVASIADTTSFTSTYNDYEIQFDNILPATNTVSLRLRVNSGGVQSASYLTNYLVSNSGGVGQAASTTFFPCSYPASGTVSNTANGGGVSGRMTLYQAAATTFRKMMNGTFAYLNITPALEQGLASGYWDGGNGAVTGIEISFSSGNITSGTVKIYGIVN
jgi:hypothetical protein